MRATVAGAAGSNDVRLAEAAVEQRVRTVYLEPAWKGSLSLMGLVEHPPEGYRFLVAADVPTKWAAWAARWPRAYDVKGAAARHLPMDLVYAALRSLCSPPPAADLTYAATHLIFRRKPWVLDMQTEPPMVLVGSGRQLRRYRGLVRRVLESPHCRRIVCWLEAGRRAMISAFGSQVAEKVETVYWGVPIRPVISTQERDSFKILFVNSGNIAQAAHFYAKGGREVIEAFLALRRRTERVELVVRSYTPRSIREQYERLPGLRILHDTVPWRELEREWQTANVFILPTRLTPAMGILDALSYGLPVITTDVWGNPEQVTDGVTGLLIPYAAARGYIKDGVPEYDCPQYRAAIDRVDPDLVQGIVQRLVLLMEDEGLRRRMAAAARREVETGRFSLAARNQRLKRVLERPSVLPR